MQHVNAVVDTCAVVVVSIIIVLVVMRLLSMRGHTKCPGCRKRGYVHKRIVKVGSCTKTEVTSCNACGFVSNVRDVTAGSSPAGDSMATVEGYRIGWYDSAKMPSRIHRTVDGGETTACGHRPGEMCRTGVWSSAISTDIPKHIRGTSRYCKMCFARGGKANPWIGE